jgi:uncharacterized protein YndB with AHSA1/START domain
MGQERVIKQSVAIRKPSSIVFQALLDPDEVCKWFADDANVDPREGGRFEVLDDGFWSKGRVLKLVENRRLSFTLALREEGVMGPTRVEYNLEPRGQATQLSLTHSGFGSGPEWEGVFHEFEAYWPSNLDSLKRFVETRKATRKSRSKSA